MVAVSVYKLHSRMGCARVYADVFGQQVCHAAGLVGSPRVFSQ